MDRNYYELKQKLEELGYNNKLPFDAIPLVECLLADLLQTTRSLQHYMELSKDALNQRDNLVMEAEPYKYDNARLIEENNKFHKEMMEVKEENIRISKQSKRKIKNLNDELVKKDELINRLQHDLRDLSLRGLCAGTQSSRNKSRRKDAGDDVSKICSCTDSKCNKDDEINNLKTTIERLQKHIDSYVEEITLLKAQVDNRDSEIIRLNMVMEGGRPPLKIPRVIVENNDEELEGEIKLLKAAHETTKRQLAESLQKQHEAMMKALNLADKNKELNDEIKKVDALALRVEEDCNKRITTLVNEVKSLRDQLEKANTKYAALEKERAQNRTHESGTSVNKLRESLNNALQEKHKLQDEVEELRESNKALCDKVTALESDSKDCLNNSLEKHKSECPSINDMQTLLESERSKYEKYMADVQEKLSGTMSFLNTHLKKCKGETDDKNTHENAYVRDMHVKLCESEQKILMLKKDNDELKYKLISQDSNHKQNYKDIISQLNAENAELSKENIDLIQKLNCYKNAHSDRDDERTDYLKRDIQRLKKEIEKLTSDSQTLRRDKHEYNLRCKESVEIIEKYKRDLAMKQKEIEQLQEENASYKMSHRTGRASAEHLREECNFLRQQIKKMQTDVIKEKTMASQIKNIQMETERSSNEIQNELLALQKKISIANDTIDSLKQNCYQLESEISSLRSEKSNMIDNIKRVDQERDKLVMELDNKAELNSVLEQKLNSQNFEINKLENEVAELRRTLNTSKLKDHKIVDSEAQIRFLNGEISRITHQYDNAVMENKHLQNSLADANGKLKLTKIEYEKSRKEVAELRQQLQHYVAEIRRIEELLSQKEAERSDMLEHFASLSVEANILENTNHSLESESASKSLQLQNYVIKIQELESKLFDKESLIETQSSRIADMLCKIGTLEKEVKLVTEEKIMLEQNVAHLKQMYNSKNVTEHKQAEHTDSELTLYENKIKSLSKTKYQFEAENVHIKGSLETAEKLLSDARKEVIELKLALQDATAETQALKERINRMSSREIEEHEVGCLLRSVFIFFFIK